MHIDKLIYFGKVGIHNAQQKIYIIINYNLFSFMNQIKIKIENTI